MLLLRWPLARMRGRQETVEVLSDFDEERGHVDVGESAEHEPPSLAPLYETIRYPRGRTGASHWGVIY
jgi:hypothetical protein